MHSSKKGIGFGIFLLTLGVLWLLGMAGIVTWSTLNALLTLWPLVLVAMGIGFIFRNNGIIRTLTWLVLVAVIVTYGYYAHPDNVSWLKYDLHFGDQTNYTSHITNVTMSRQPQVEKGELELDYGAMKLNIGPAASGLIDANVDESIVNHTETYKDNGTTASIVFKTKNENIINLGNTNRMRSDFKLSKDVVWNLKLNTGAIDGKLDLSQLKVESLDVGTGASSLDIDMGSCNTGLKISSGASTINITLPEDTGMKVRFSGGLNNSNLNRNGWVKDGEWYYSEGYESKQYKIDAEIDNGVGNLKVEYR